MKGYEYNDRRSLHEERRSDVENERYYDVLDTIESIISEFEHLQNQCNGTINVLYEIMNKFEDSEYADNFNYFQNVYKNLRGLYRTMIEFENEISNDIHKPLVSILYDK